MSTFEPNHESPDREAIDRRIDAGLAESLGGDRAPDVTARVLAALRETEVRRSPQRSRLLVAAAVLVLGALVVFATREARREALAPADAGQDPARTDREGLQEPVWTEVADSNALAQLPETSTAVQLRNLDDRAVDTLLARCPQLQHLAIHCSTIERRDGDPNVPVSISDEALATIAKFGALRTLRLDGCHAITGANLRELTNLPLLASLRFRFCSVSDEGLDALSRLPSLRCLELQGTLGFGEDGLRAIADCTGLQRLVIAGCGPLRYPWFAPLERLQGLRELSLAGCTSLPGFGLGLAEKDLHSYLARTKEVVGARMRTAMAARDEGGTLLDLVRRWPRLRTLDLAECFAPNEFEEETALTEVVPDPRSQARPSEPTRHGDVARAAALAIVRNCPDLEVLCLARGVTVDDEVVRQLASMRALRSLDLAHCEKLTAACVPSLCEAKALRELRFADAAWLSIELVQQLLSAGKTVAFENADDPRAEAERTRRETEARKRADGAQQADHQAPQEPGWIEVDDAKIVAQLPKASTAVQLRNLGDASLETLLATCPDVQHLSIYCSTVLRRHTDPADPESITDAAFATIAKFASLRTLRIEGTDAITGATLGELAALPLLETLRFRFCDTSDEGLAVLPRLQSLRTLEFHGDFALGEAGLRAIADCPGLVKLSLSACGRMPFAWFKPLERLRHLQQLDLAGLTHHRGIGVGLSRTREDRLAGKLQRLLAQRDRDLRREGVEAGTFVDAICNWPSLRTLDLSADLVLTPSNVDRLDEYLLRKKAGTSGAEPERTSHAVAKRLLVACPSIEMLKVAHCSAVDDEFVQEVTHLPELRTLDLSNCSSLTAECVPPLLAAKSLREVRFAEADWLSLELVDRLLEAGRAVTNTRPKDRAYEEALAQRVAAKAPNRGAPGKGTYARVIERGKLEALPPSLDHIELVNLGDQAALFLRKRGGVRGLAFVLDGKARKPRQTDDLTDVGLSLLAGLPTLVELRLVGDHALDERALAAIGGLKPLRSLAVVGNPRLDDAAVRTLLQQLPDLERLSLNGCVGVTEGVLDAVRSAPKLVHFDATALGWMTVARARELEKAKPGLAIVR